MLMHASRSQYDTQLRPHAHPLHSHRHRFFDIKANATIKVRPLRWGDALGAFQNVWNMSKSVLLDKSPAFLEQSLKIARDLRVLRKRASFIVLSRSACLRHSPDSIFFFCFLEL
jgi:hypothetical protein